MNTVTVRIVYSFIKQLRITPMSKKLILLMWVLVSSLSCVVSTQAFGGNIVSFFISNAEDEDEHEDEQYNGVNQGAYNPQIGSGQRVFAPAMEAQLTIEGLIVNELERYITRVGVLAVADDNNPISRNHHVELLRRLIAAIENVAVEHGFLSYRLYNPEELAVNIPLNDNQVDDGNIWETILQIIAFAVQQAELDYHAAIEAPGAAAPTADNAKQPMRVVCSIQAQLRIIFDIGGLIEAYMVEERELLQQQRQ
jgi:hypothetical protein